MIGADVREVLERAEASHRYGAHLIDSALNMVDVPPSRPRAVGLMACEHIGLAARVLVAPDRAVA